MNGNGWKIKERKTKKYELSLPNNEAFALAGLWNEWVDKETGKFIPAFTILTTEANELMARIHNAKKRMPVKVSEQEEMLWLQGAEITITEKIVAQMV